MKKIIPILNLILALASTIAAIFVFSNAIIAMTDRGVQGAVLMIVVVSFLVFTTGFTVISMCLGFLFSKSKICRVAGFISLGGFILSVASWILIYLA